MYPTLSVGTLLLIIATTVVVLLLYWMHTIKSHRTVQLDQGNVIVGSLTAEALREISSKPPNFRSMIDILAGFNTHDTNSFLAETEKQRRKTRVSAQEFRPILRSYLWSARLMEDDGK